MPSVQDINQRIFFLRGQRVLLDSDIAKLYGVETKALNRAVRRNEIRFPKDFMFQLTEIEDETLRRQIGTSNDVVGRGGRRYLPLVFTEPSELDMLITCVSSNSKQFKPGERI